MSIPASKLLVLPSAILRHIPHAQRKRCEQVWRQYVPPARRQRFAEFIDAPMLGEWFPQFATRVAVAERAGHGAQSGEVAYQHAVAHSLANISRIKHKWAVHFANAGDPRTWEQWPQFFPTLQDAVVTLWQDWCVMPGTFKAPGGAVDGVRPPTDPLNTPSTDPERLAS